MLLKWQDIFAVGHQGLDIEHERMVGFINRIYEAEASRAANQLSNLLNALHFTAMEHFRHENSLMRDIIAGAYLPRAGCGKLSEAVVNEHCAEHAYSLMELESMLRSFDCNCQVDLAVRLRHWFIDHATKHDAHLRGFFQPE